jgi:hypothetical protein
MLPGGNSRPVFLIKEDIMGKQRNIYMGNKLQELANSMIGGSFSRRLNEIVDRYTLILATETVPDFSDREKVALGEVLLNAELTRSKIKGLSLDIEDLGNEFLNNEERHALATKIEPLTPAQIVKILESIEKKMD